MKIKTLRLATAAAIVPFSPLQAQVAQPQAGATDAAASGEGSGSGTTAPTPGDAAAAHPDEDNAIVVTGTRRTAGDVLGSVSVIDKEELTHDIKPSLGDTLADMPGVSSTSFGPSSSRPILRGEQGERAPVLVDGISSLDLSSTDPDHGDDQRARLHGASKLGHVRQLVPQWLPRTRSVRLRRWFQV